MRRPLLADNAPNATISALAGAADHCGRLISCVDPGVAWGAMAFDTMSKMPALARSLKRVESKVALSAGVSGSAPTGLKSAAAMRMRAWPRLVPVWTQSCAWSARDKRQMTARKTEAKDFDNTFMCRAILPRIELELASARVMGFASAP